MAKGRKKAKKKKKGNNSNSTEAVVTNENQPETSSPTRRKSAREKRQEQTAKAAQRRWLRILGIAGLIIGGFVMLALMRNSGNEEIAAVAADRPKNIDGLVDAPVTIMEFGDFGCPACRSWHNAGIKRQLQADFGEQINFEFRHFPVITPQSPQAAEAAQCAGDQDAFWTYHDFIYEQTPHGQLSRDNMKEYASAVGLNRTEFDNCFDSGKYRGLIQSELRAARQAGARGTPTFFIDDEQVAPSYNSMVAAIEQALAN